MKTIVKTFQTVVALAVCILLTLTQEAWAQQAWSLQPDIAPIKDGSRTALFGMVDLSPQSIVYQVGSAGLIQKKESIGSDWVVLNTGITATLRGIYMLDQTVGWAVGDGVILKTTNQGQTWTATSFPGVNFQAIGGDINSALVAVGSGGAVYRSGNFGTSWTQVGINTSNTLNDVVVAGSDVFAVGNNGTICRSNDNGVTWTTSSHGTSHLYAVAVGPLGTFAVGGSGIILKYVSGQTWNTVSSGTSQILRGVISYTGATLAVGDGGTILKTTNGTSWNSVTTGFTENLHTIVKSNDLLWVVGSRGSYVADVQNSPCTTPVARTSISNNNPVELSGCVGGSITFSAYDHGTVATRVWKKNGGAFNYSASSPHVHPRTITINNLQASDAGVYTMEVTSPCGSATTQSFTLSVNSTQQPSVVVGQGSFVVNVPATFSVSPIAGATFTWNAGAGGTVTGSGNSVQISWNTAGLKSFSVTATDACGTSIPRNASVNVVSCAIPAQPSAITLISGAECSGSSASYTVTNVPGVNYTWTVNGGGTITSNGNNATVNWTASGGPYTIQVIPSSSCGTGSSSSRSVTTGSLPSQPGVITGSATVCTGVSTPYSVPNVAGVTYTWNTGGAGTITGSGNAINVTWTSAGAKTLTVTPSTACGNGTPRTLAVTVNTVPSQPSVIAGSTSVTTGVSNQYSVSNESGVTYSWNAGTGGTVTGSGNSVNISWSSAGSKTITLTPANACGNGATRTLNVTVTDCAVPSQPSVISGATTACIGGSGTYSVSNINGVNYVWNAGTDGLVSGSGNSVTLSWTSTGSKTITVTPSNACGNGTARTMNVTVSQLPAQPSVISGSATPCKDASVAYSITNVGGVTYTWSVIGAGTITGSGNSINVTWPATGSHTLRVTPSNACGSGVARTLDVIVGDVPLAANQITGSTGVCAGTSTPYSVVNVPGVTYTWSGGSGSTITGSGNAVSISWATGGTKTVSVTPSNGCGNGATNTKDVDVSTTPSQPSTITGSTAVVGGVAQSYSVTNVPNVTYTWSTNADGVLSSVGNTAQVTWATAGSKTLTVTPSNLCGNGTARSLTVTTTVPCTIPGVPSSITLDPGAGLSTNINLDGFRRFVVGASSGATSLNISITPTTGTTITPVFGNTWDITFTVPGTYIVSGFGEISGCGAGAPASITVTVCTGTVPDPTPISGLADDLCRGTTTRYSVTPINGAAFDWSLSSASGTITPVNADRSVVDVTWSSAAVSADVLSVRAKNACNTQSNGVSKEIHFKLKPSYAGFGLQLTGSICAGGGGGLFMSIGLPESGTTYKWQMNGSGSVAGDNLSATAFADGVSRQIKIYGTNACFTDEFLTGIDYGGGTPVPVLPSPVSGPTTIDVNTDGTYTVDSQGPVVSLYWDAGTDATITAGASSNIKNIRWSTGGLKTVSVQAANSCGITANRTYTVFVNGPCEAPSVPSEIFGSTVVCAGVEYQYVTPAQGFDTFNWSAGADATITGSGNLRTIKWSTGGSKTISVTATNLCTTSAAQTLSVTVNTIPAQPAALTGSASGCNGATQQFSLGSPVAGVTYTWEIQGGTFVTSGAQGQVVDITWTSVGVNQIKLKPSNSCGNGTARTLDVTVGTVPAQPSAMSGDAEVCAGTSKSYSVTNIAGVTYAWSAGAGSTVTGTGNQVNISWTSAGAKAVTVTPSNSCGNGTNQTLSVTVKGVPNQPAAITGAASPTLGASEAYSVTPVAGVNYAWALPSKGVLTASGNGSSVQWNATGSTTLSVTPSNSCGNGTARTLNVAVNKLSQSITFTLTSPVAASETVSLEGTSSSGLPIVYTSSDNSIAEVFGSELFIRSAGVVDITASQSGDESFAAAPNVVRSLTINKSNQLITFDALPTPTFGDDVIELTATSDSELPLTYSSSNTDVATVAGNQITIVGAGSADITATQGGDAKYNAATPVVRALTVNKADQTIAFESLLAKGISDPPFLLTAASSSGLTISYTSSNTAVATISGNTVTIVGPGTTTIRASQTGNANYLPATPVDQQLTVNTKQGQSITFGTLAPREYGSGDFNLEASASSGLSVSYTSSSPSVATISGNKVTIVGVGITTITAAQEGDASFNAAPSVQQELVVSKANQNITFGPLPTRLLTEASFNLDAVSSSGLTITYSSSNPNVATINGSVVTLVGAGATTITASQPGDAFYNPAADVEQVLTVMNKDAQTITFTSLADKVFGDADFSLNASATSGLSIAYVSSNTAVAIVVGATVKIVGAGTTIITASQAGNDQFDAAEDIEQVLVVKKAAQAITFASLEQRGLTQGTFVLTATASSNLPVSYTSSSESIVAISGNTVTPLAAGSVVITAKQGGNANYDGATEVSQTLVIVDDTPTRVISVSGLLEFEDVILPGTATKTFSILNSGNSGMTVSAIDFPEGFSGTPITGTIAAGSTLQVTVTFEPTEVKSYEGVITISSNATSGTGTINAKGKGVTVTAVEDLGGLRSARVWPNPGNGIYTIEVRKPLGNEIQVMDEAGRVSLRTTMEPVGKDLYQIDITTLASGVYYLRLAADQEVKVVRVIKIN